MTNTIRVVVVDDHPLVLRGTCDTIDEAPDLEVVGRGENGDQALSLVDELRPDVLVLDVHMPGRDGVSVVRELAASSGPRPRVVLLTSANDEANILRGLQAGADGYLLKTAREEEVQRAVRLVAGGTPALFQPEVARAMLASHRAGDLVDPISERELAVLKTLAKDLSNREIGTRLGISDRTVQQHLSNIFSKLGVASRTGAVLKALQMGTITLEDTRE